MKIILIVFAGLWPVLASAQSPTPTIPTVVETDVVTKKKNFVLEQRNFWGMMGAGLDFRVERDQDLNTDMSQAPAFSLGLGYKHFLGAFEYTSSEGSRDGNETLNVRRSSESAMLWGQYYTDDEWKFRPFFGVGLGARRERATSSIYNVQSEDRGKWGDMFGGAFGFRWAAFTPLWLTLEGRVLFSRDFDPNPTLGGLFKVGFVLE